MLAKKQLSSCAAIALVVGSIAGSDVALGQYNPIVGEPHPDFVLPRIDNRRPVSLSKFRGKKVLLVHFASW